MRFTVAIPAYKGKFLRESIASVLNQSYKDFELIVVDDASPDNLYETVRQFNDDRLHFHRNDRNMGAVNVVDNWNKCLSLAHGDYICLLGDDDIMGENYLKAVDELARKYPAANAFHGRTMEIDENGECTLLHQAWPEWQSVYDLIWHRIARLRVTFVSDFTFKVSALKSVGGYYKLPLAWGSDDITSYLMAEKGGIASTNNVIFYYRRHSTSITSSGSAKPKLEAIEQEGQWLTGFVAASVPSTDEDAVLKRMILSQIPAHLSYRKSLEICQLWRKRMFAEILELSVHGRKNHLSLRQIVRGIAMAIGN